MSCSSRPSPCWYEAQMLLKHKVEHAYGAYNRVPQ